MEPINKNEQWPKKKASVKLDGDPGMGGAGRQYTGKGSCWLTRLQMVHSKTQFTDFTMAFFASKMPNGFTLHE